MMLDNKPTLSLEQADLVELINQVSEGKSIDFKSDLHGDTDGDKKEFLADVSSLANASGGYLIYGMKEVKGIASALPGISNVDPDREKQRIENLIRDGIAPRIIGITIRPIKLENGNYSVIIHVPKSWASPHMVIFKGTSRFFTRNSSGKYQMDVHEIRQSFLVSESISQKIRDFRLDRLSQISALDTPVPLTEGAKVVLHSVPLSAFQSVTPINISGTVKDIFKLLPQANQYRFNLDGLVIYSNIKENRIAYYRQLFRNGSVEAVDNYLLSSSIGRMGIPSAIFESEIIKTCEDILQFQEKLGVETPIFIFLTLLHVKGYTMIVDQDTALLAVIRNYDQEINSDVISFPEIVVENYSSISSLPDLMKPVFDACWNASGWPRSMNYDESGKWKISKR